MSNHYNVAQLKRPQAVADLGRDCSALFHNFGADFTRKNNLQLIEQSVVIYALGNTVVFENIEDNTKKYLLGLDDGGVGCVAVHPSKKMFAVGGRGFQPNVYIYSYPELIVINVLKGGAERGYSSLSYNAHGNKLATVATSPDYMLTVWDWQKELVELHAKAFGQEVFGVKFSKDDDARLCTSGTGHIRFWKMASTFTGLKLQGHIGKFGKVELSDVYAIEELPDGKVVSGTESGALLLWEGNFIKCRFVQVGGKPCHVGNVTYVELDREEKCVITAAADGWIRWWDFTAIDQSEVDADISLDFELLPVAEYYLGDGHGVKGMLDCGNQGLYRSFVVHDSQGSTTVLKFSLTEPIEPFEEGDDRASMVKKGMFKGSVSRSVLAYTEAGDFTDDNIDKPSAKNVAEYHSGAVTGLCTFPDAHVAVTSGVDGAVRVWDYANKSLLCSRRFDVAATSLANIPAELNHQLEKDAKHILVGFADGTARILMVGQPKDKKGEFTIMQKAVLKPHGCDVNALAFNEDASMLITSSTEGTIFLFRTGKIPLKEGQDVWTPLRLMHVLPNAMAKQAVYADKISWKPDGSALLLSCSDSILREVDISSSYEMPEECDTYEHEFPMKDFKGQILHKVEVKKVIEAVDEEGSQVGDGDGDSITPASPTKAAEAPEEIIEYLSLKVSKALYKNGVGGDSTLYAGVTSSMHRSHLLEFEGVNGSVVKTTEGDEVVETELPPQDAIYEHTFGLYAGDGKANKKTPLPTSMEYSISKNFLGIGTSDGSVVVKPSNFSATFFRVSAHNGDVNFVAMSFDDKFVLSAGADGVLAVHTVDIELVASTAEPLWMDMDAGVYDADVVKRREKKDVEAEEAMVDATLLEGEDILSPRSKKLGDMPLSLEADAPDMEVGAYSIQDAKLKSEEDAKKITAEEVKEKQRALVKNLQREYDSIWASNVALPESVRLDTDSMMIDKEVFQSIQADGATQVNEVIKECEREAERSAKLRDKVRQNLMDGLIVDEMTLSALDQQNGRKANCMVRTFRTQGLPQSLLDLITNAEDSMKDIVVNENASMTGSVSANKSGQGAPLNMQNMLDEGSVSTSVIKEESDDKHAASAGARREARKIRKANILLHKKEEPKDDEDDERDINAIDLAQRTIGDYKLKVSPDYEVPANQHVDAGKKKLQMALLEESIVKIRLGFNERFLALRDLKKELVYGIKRSNQRVREIDSELSQSHLSENLWEPVLVAAEYPDDRDRVIETDLQAYSEAREKTMNEKDGWLKTPVIAVTCIDPKKIRLVPKNYASGEYDCQIQPIGSTSYTELGLTLADPADMSQLPSIHDAPRLHEVNDAPLKNYILDAEQSVSVRAKNIESKVSVLSRVARARKQITRTDEAVEQEKQERMRKLRFEREWLIKNIQENVDAFREAIDNLRVDRHVVLADMKLAELKLLSLFQEYSILLGFESRDNMLIEKQRRSSKDLATIELEVSDQQATLETKEGDKKVLMEEAVTIADNFEAQLPTTHPYYEQLRKIYRKKVKRGGEGDGEGEEEEEENEEEDEEEEEEDDEEVDDTCPPGCDPGLHEKILEMRDRKLDNDEASSALQKQIDDTKRAYERLRTRLKQVAKDVKQSVSEIQSFQLQKQSSLNLIDVTIPLSMNQVYMFEMSGGLTGPVDDATEGADEETKAIEEADAVDLTLLNDPKQRQLVSKAGMKDFCLIREGALSGLSARIGDLRQETEEARKQYSELRKERVVLSKSRDMQFENISKWKAKVRDLQMLKFGREIDLDDLEAGSNRSKEDEAEKGLKEQEDANTSIAWKLTKEGEHLREKLAKAMVSNTELLRTVGDLTEDKLNITRDLNAPGNNVSTESKDEGRSEREERQKVIAYVQLQAREIEALRAELIMLKRKEAPQMSQIIGQTSSANPPGAPSVDGTVSYEGQLPPIPGAQSTNQMNRTNQR